jgi:hypothetical protein
MSCLRHSWRTGDTRFRLHLGILGCGWGTHLPGGTFLVLTREEGKGCPPLRPGMSPESACALHHVFPAVPSALNTHLWLMSGRRDGEQTTQGGPPSGDRKYGTGGDLAYFGGEEQCTQGIPLMTGKGAQGTNAGRSRGVARSDAPIRASRRWGTPAEGETGGTSGEPPCGVALLLARATPWDNFC